MDFQGNCGGLEHEKKIIFLKDFIYLFMIDGERERERERQRHRDTGRGRSRLHERSPMWDSISGPWDHALSRRQMLNC